MLDVMMDDGGGGRRVFAPGGALKFVFFSFFKRGSVGACWDRMIPPDKRGVSHQSTKFKVLLSYPG